MPIFQSSTDEYDSSERLRSEEGVRQAKLLATRKREFEAVKREVRCVWTGSVCSEG